MKPVLKIILLLIVSGCASHQPGSTVPARTSTEQKVIASPKPSWLVTKPQSDVYYTGIGNAYLSDADYLQIAKKEALDDLATEISTRISSQSVLYQVDAGNRFKEEYTSTIRAEVNRDIEAYELVESWSDDQLYWVYYRLSKETYQRLKNTRKKTALDIGMDYYLKGEAMVSQNDYSSALRYYFQTLEAIKDYLGEDTQVTHHSKVFLLANETYAALQSILGKISFSGPDKLIVSNHNVTEKTFPVTANYNDTDGNMAVKNMPVIISSGPATYRTQTEAQGILRIGSDLLQGTSVRVKTDLKAYANSFSGIVQALATSLQVPEKQFSVDRKPMTVCVVSDENNFGMPLDSPILKSIITGRLSSNNILFTDRTEGSDIIISVTSDTRKGSEVSGLFTAYLDVDLKVMQAATKKVFYAKAVHDIKGIQLSWEKAGFAAYKDSQESIEENLLADVLKEVFKHD